MNETMDLPRCPSATELRAFAVGDLGAADMDRISGHILDCEPCDRALRSLDGMTDDLLRSLHELRPQTQVSSPLPAGLLQVARSAGHTSGRKAGSDVSLD